MTFIYFVFFRYLCCIFIYLSGLIFATLSSNNTSTINNPTNETWCDSDCMKFAEFLGQLLLAKKILYILLSIVIIKGNTLVLLTTWRERSLHQPNKYFIAGLAVADLLVGIFIGPVMVFGMSLDFESLGGTSIHLCRFLVWIDTLAVTASVYTLMFISFDRYLKISKPLQYQSKSLKIIFIIWLISAAFATYAATPDSGSTGFLTGVGIYCLDHINYSETTSKSKGYETFRQVSVIFLPAIVILIMYALIFVVAHKRQKMLRNGELGQTCTVQNQRSALRQDLKIVRMLLIVVGVFFTCWFPYSITIFLISYTNIPEHVFENWNNLRSFLIYSTVLSLLPLINSLCNPIIYACLDQSYREAFKHLFQKMMCRKRPNTQQQPAAIELRPLRNT